MKKLVSLVLIGILAVSMLSGCGSSTSSKNGELNLFIWTEYVPDSVIKKFEKEYDIKVNVSTYSTNEDMLAKVKSESAGTYDIVQPSDYMVQHMIEQGMLEKLNQKALTNISNMGSQYLNAAYDPGNVYSVPYQGGVAAIGVNTKKVNLNITSYNDLFNTALKKSIVSLDDYRAVIGMTERSMGLSMNETNPDTLKKVQDKLLTLKNNMKVYDSDSPKSSLISGDCTVAYCWSAEIALAMKDNPDIKIVYPKEGAYKFMDNWCVAKGSKNQDNAMKFINFMMEPEVAQMVMKEYPYLNPNSTAVKAMGADYMNNQAENVPSDVVSNGEFVQNLNADTLAIYDSMWTKLKE